MTTRRYLLIDDNRQFADNVAEILGDAGAEVRVANGGPAALELLKQERFDGVVTDMKMPGLSGAQLLELVRDIDPGVPVILLSAYSHEEQVAEAKRFGLLAFLSKPARMERLLELLHHARRDATVLLIEDDRALADSLVEALALHGFTVACAHSLRELDTLEVQPMAAVVDLRIPGDVDGAALERVQQRFPHTPIFVVTGLSNPAPSEATEFFRKPFDPQRVIDRLEALARHRAMS